MDVNPTSMFIYRFRAICERLKMFYGPLPESQGQNLAQTVLFAPICVDGRSGEGGCRAF